MLWLRIVLQTMAAILSSLAFVHAAIAIHLQLTLSTLELTNATNPGQLNRSTNTQAVDFPVSEMLDCFVVNVELQTLNVFLLAITENKTFNSITCSKITTQPNQKVNNYDFFVSMRLRIR